MKTTTPRWLSVCCAAPPLGEVAAGHRIASDPRGTRWQEEVAVGTCSRCREHTTFEKDQDHEQE